MLACEGAALCSVPSLEEAALVLACAPPPSLPLSLPKLASVCAVSSLVDGGCLPGSDVSAAVVRPTAAPPNAPAAAAAAPSTPADLHN